MPNMETILHGKVTCDIKTESLLFYREQFQNEREEPYKHFQNLKVKLLRYYTGAAKMLVRPFGNEPFILTAKD